MNFEVFDFNDLVSFAREIGAVECPGSYEEFAPEDMAEIQVGEVFSDFVTYIRDRQHGREYNYNGREYNYRFHVCGCRTITDFVKRGVYDVKYWKCFIKKVKIQKHKSFIYKWPVHFIDTYTDGYSEMEVCRNCLRELDYKGYRGATEEQKERIAKEFDIIEFYDEYGTLLPLIDGIPDYMFNEYDKNWGAISRKVRENANYKCESCGRDFSYDISKLHVHHINLNKADNRNANLKVLCVDCHAKEHPHMRRKKEL